MSTDQHTGRVAVITGASSGIGEAAARALADGHRVALLARRADRIQALADEIGNGAIAIEADVTDRDSIIAAAGRVQHATRTAKGATPPSWRAFGRHGADGSPCPAATWACRAVPCGSRPLRRTAVTPASCTCVNDFVDSPTNDKSPAAAGLL